MSRSKQPLDELDDDALEESLIRRRVRGESSSRPTQPGLAHGCVRRVIEALSSLHSAADWTTASHRAFEVIDAFETLRPRPTLPYPSRAACTAMRTRSAKSMLAASRLCGSGYCGRRCSTARRSSDSRRWRRARTTPRSHCRAVRGSDACTACYANTLRVSFNHPIARRCALS